MRATVLHGPRDVSVETVPDPAGHAFPTASARWQIWYTQPVGFIAGALFGGT